MCRRADRDTAPVKSLSPTLQNTYTKHYNTVCVHNLVVSFSESYNAEFLLYKTVARYTFKLFLQRCLAMTMAYSHRSHIFNSSFPHLSERHRPLSCQWRSPLSSTEMRQKIFFLPSESEHNVDFLSLPVNTKELRRYDLICKSEGNTKLNDFFGNTCILLITALAQYFHLQH